MRDLGKFPSRRKAIKYAKVCGLTGCSFKRDGRWWKLIDPSQPERDDILSHDVKSIQPKVEAIKGSVRITKRRPPLSRSGKGKHLYRKAPEAVAQMLTPQGVINIVN